MILPAPHQDFLAELETPTLLQRFCFPLPLELPCGCSEEEGMGGLIAKPYSSLHFQSHRVKLASYHHVQCLPYKTYLAVINYYRFYTSAILEYVSIICLSGQKAVVNMQQTCMLMSCVYNLI